MLKLKTEQQEFCQKHNIAFNDNEVYIISLCNENVSKNKYELVRVKEFDNGFRNLMDKCGIEHKNKKTLYSFPFGTIFGINISAYETEHYIHH